VTRPSRCEHFSSTLSEPIGLCPATDRATVQSSQCQSTSDEPDDPGIMALNTIASENQKPLQESLYAAPARRSWTTLLTNARVGYGEVDARNRVNASFY
jgi:hypothetical protein